jgi:hypothetical protein
MSLCGRSAPQPMPLLATSAAVRVRSRRTQSRHRLSAVLGPTLACRPVRISHRQNPQKKRPPVWVAFCFEAPGSDLLSHGLSHTTIGAGAFHFRVRDGIGWYHAAVSAREAVKRKVAVMRLSLALGWDVTRFVLSLVRRDVEVKATLSYMIKPHGSLVLVSSALLRYTPNLSTT